MNNKRTGFDRNSELPVKGQPKPSGFIQEIEKLVEQGNLPEAAQHCISALEQEIEINAVQALIKKHHLLAHSLPFNVKHWPWTLKVYTLGRFSILVDELPLRFPVASQGKPVDLLKVLIALGGREVSEMRLCEALWPDSEGDNAHSAFTTTLSRLRKIIGKELLLLEHGRLSLNAHYCWVDSWAFERTLGELEIMLAKNDSRLQSGIQHRVSLAFDLYHGLFMEKEPTQGWMLPQRERLHTKFLRIIKMIVQHYRDSGGQCAKVIALYEKARELDPLSEEYCRGLMRCHAAQGNRPEALAIFDRCNSILKETFGIKPSAKTTHLHKLIKADDQDRIQGFCEICIEAAE